jgi:hypothetical protein
MYVIEVENNGRNGWLSINDNQVHMVNRVTFASVFKTEREAKTALERVDEKCGGILVRLEDNEYEKVDSVPKAVSS